MADSPSLIVSAKVRGVMGEMQVTQTALAERTGLLQAVISNRLRGRTRWTIDDLVEVAEALDVPLKRVLPLDELANRRAS